MRTLTICLACLPLLLFSTPTQADEVAIKFRHHPDHTGRNTTNQEIAAEPLRRKQAGRYEARIEGEGEGGGAFRVKKIEITRKQYDALIDLVRDGLKQFRFEDGPKIEGPYVEVLLEYQGENRELEITYTYPAGKVPAQYVKLQDRYFKKTYR